MDYAIQYFLINIQDIEIFPPRPANLVNSQSPLYTMGIDFKLHLLLLDKIIHAFSNLITLSTQSINISGFSYSTLLNETQLTAIFHSIK